MCSEPPDPLRIEVEPRSEPIAGRLYVGRQPVRSFAGWLQLVALLESARRPPGGSSDEPGGAPENAARVD